jgi:hypothetical protein
MCVLRAVGTTFDPDAFLSTSSLPRAEAYRAGEPRLPRTQPHGPRYQRSGLTIGVSEAEWDDLPSQVLDALNFLRAHREEVSQLVAFPGVEAVKLDFPCPVRADGVSVLAQFEYLPPALLAEAGTLGVGIELSLYRLGEADE